MATTDMLRPQTAMGFNNLHRHCANQVKLGDDLLLPGFQKHLKDFYMKASPNDRLKCTDLIAALDHCDSRSQHFYNDKTELRPKRPVTAMASLEQYRDPLDPYCTTYKREYLPLRIEPTKPLRPKSSIHPTRATKPRRTTTYETEFCYRGKPVKADPESPDPHSRNNPHPGQGFIMWRLPRGAKMDARYPNDCELTDQLYDEVMRGQLESTYQKDYVGIPPGKEGVRSVKLAFADLRDTRTNAPYTLDTFTRHTYQTPHVRPELTENTSRYGCNKQKQVAVTGIVPMVSSRYLKVKPRTTYEREFSYCNNRTIAAEELRKHREREIRQRNRAMLRSASPASSDASSQYDVHPTRCLESPTSDH